MVDELVRVNRHQGGRAGPQAGRRLLPVRVAAAGNPRRGRHRGRGQPGRAARRARGRYAVRGGAQRGDRALRPGARDPCPAAAGQPPGPAVAGDRERPPRRPDPYLIHRMLGRTVHTDEDRRSRGGAMLVVGLAVDSLGNGLFVPLTLIYFVVLTDVPLPMIGVALTVANVVTLPVPLWAGALADRWGPLRLVVAAQVLQAGGYLAYLFGGDLAGILGAATLISVGVRVFWSTLFTAIADYVDTSATEWTKDTWYAVANGARTAGLAVGGLVTGLVVSVGEAAAYRAVAWGTAACFVA